MHISRQLLRFALVGVLNTLLDAGLFALLHSHGLHVTTANFISSSCGILLSLALNSHYTFRVQKIRSRQVILFVTINLFELWVLQPITILLLLPYLDWLRAFSLFTSTFSISFLASLLVTAVTFIWNYVLYSKIIYQKIPKTKDS
jgi:putative flippase GtrA